MGTEIARCGADAGWRWKTEAKITHPAFWKRTGGEWRYRTMFDEIALPLRLAGVREPRRSQRVCEMDRRDVCPSEPQWHRAAYGSPAGEERKYPWGGEAPDPRHGYFDFARWDPTPVNAFPCGRSAFGVEGLLG